MRAPKKLLTYIVAVWPVIQIHTNKQENNAKALKNTRKNILQNIAK